MLRSVTIENFVRFKERVFLKFEEGANFIIGGNSTGKSSIFELIRRCYSNSFSTSSSTVPNPEKTAYTVCSFDPVESITVGETKYCILFSSYIINPPKNGTKSKLKIFGIKADNKLYIVGITAEDDTNVDEVDFWCEYSGTNEWIQNIMSMHNQDNEDDLPVLKKRKIDTSTPSKIREKDMQIPSIDDINYLLSLKAKGQDRNENLKKELLKVFHQLNESFVNTFPQRSIGPLQWNHSTRLKCKKPNYEDANKRAEILRTLLKEQENGQTDHYFESMISPRTAEFEINASDEIEVIMDGNKENPVSVLKVPEGILECKQLSLILKYKKYQTICLEEPDHGMHPQLIERMRNFVLRAIKGKTVIIISHCPSLLNQWALERTHVCCIQGDDTSSSRIYRPDLKGKNYVECGEIKRLLFSSHVLLVEGDSDAIHIQALFDQEMEDLSRHIDSTQYDALRNCLSKVQIIKLLSKFKYPGVADLCRNLKIKHMVLLDSDAYNDEKLRNRMLQDKEDHGLPDKEYSELKSNRNNCTPKCQEHCKGKCQKEFKHGFKKMFHDNYNVIKTKLRKGVFIWREGDLEDVIEKGTGENRPKKTSWQNETSDEIKEKVKKVLGDLEEEKSFSLLLREIVEYFREETSHLTVTSPVRMELSRLTFPKST